MFHNRRCPFLRVYTLYIRLSSSIPVFSWWLELRSRPEKASSSSSSFSFSSSSSSFSFYSFSSSSSFSFSSFSSSTQHCSQGSDEKRITGNLRPSKTLDLMPLFQDLVLSLWCDQASAHWVLLHCGKWNLMHFFSWKHNLCFVLFFVFCHIYSTCP